MSHKANTRLKSFIILGVILGFQVAYAETVELNEGTRTALALSIYKQNLALINDTRRANVPKGAAQLNFQGVSPLINAASAIIRDDSGNSRVTEQNYRPSISSADMLRSALGKTVTLLNTHPVSGEQTRQRAKVISVNGGVIFEIDGHYETDLAGRHVLYDDLPVGELRPSLRAHISSDQAQESTFDLAYLSGGLSWQADYIAELNDENQTLNLTALATVKNQSGVDFNQAKIDLVAGSVNKVQNALRKQRGIEMMSAMADSSDGVSSQPLGDLYLYSLPNKFNLANKSSKQISLFQARDIPFRKRYQLAGQSYLYYSAGAPEQKLKIDSFLEFKNSVALKLGQPMPAGIIRSYQKSSQGSQLKFIGEDRIGHTAKGEILRIKTGQAFDLNASKRQISYRRLPVQKPYREHIEVEIETEIRNAKEEAVSVNVQEMLAGDWTLLEGPEPAESGANFANWKLSVPAKGKAVLRIKLRFKS